MSVVDCEPVPAQKPISSAVRWPAKVDLFGLGVSVTDYDSATASVLEAAKHQTPAVVTCHAVHAIVTASGDPDLRAKVNTFELVTPDGQPVRWAMNLLHRAGLTDRVYGPELMLHLCRAAAELLQQAQDERFEAGGQSGRCQVGATGVVLRCWPMMATVSSPTNGGRPVTIS